MDADVQAALEERDRLIAELRGLVAAQQELLDGFMAHGLDALLFGNLFAASGGTGGTTRQAARSDHTH